MIRAKVTAEGRSPVKPEKTVGAEDEQENGDRRQPDEPGAGEFFRSSPRQRRQTIQGEERPQNHGPKNDAAQESLVPDDPLRGTFSDLKSRNGDCNGSQEEPDRARQG